VINVPLAMAQRHPQYKKRPVNDYVFLSLGMRAGMAMFSSATV